MNGSQRVPNGRALDEARRNHSPSGTVIDTFELPNAYVRPSIFLWIRLGLKWLAWSGVAVVAILIMVYPRESLFNALTAVKFVGESWHEAFGPPTKKPTATPTAVAKTDSKNNTPVASGTAVAGKPEAKPGAQPAKGGTMVINNNGTGTGTGQPQTPKVALNLVVPLGSAGSKGVPAQTMPQGAAPSSIVINNNGSGAGGGLPPISVTQVGGTTGDGPSLTPETAQGGAPPSITVNGGTMTPASVTINGQTVQVGGASTDTDQTVGAPGLHRIMGNSVSNASWPRQVAVRGTPEVTALERKDGSKHEYAVKTEHYEFISETKLGDDVVRELARVFEATYELNKALPLGLHPAPEKDRLRFVARLFSRDRDYFAAGGMTGSSGTYSRDQGCILVPVSSMGVKVINGRAQTDRTDATETLVHEITHQMMNKWLPVLPRWYAEGSAEYVAMADYLHGRFFLNQMEDRLRLYLKRRGQKERDLKMIRPRDLMALDGKTWSNAVASNAAGASLNYASAALLTYYFYHLDGNGDAAAINKYLRAIDKGQPEPEAFKLLMGERTADDLETELINAFDQRGIYLNLVSSH